MKNKWILITAIILFAVVFAFAGWKLMEQQREYQAGEETYTGLETHIDIPERAKLETDNNEGHDPSVGEREEDTQKEDSIVWPVVDFEALQEINPDIVAWIYLEDTKINYPVVQGDDNSYYLKHTFEGKRNSAGCLFLDNRNQKVFSDRHSIIYGHHMKSGTMFSDLDKYKKQAFYDDHPTILLMTPNQNYTIEVFAGYVASVEDEAWKLGFTPMGYEEWLGLTEEKSCFDSLIEPVAMDRVITLSTCSNEFDNARFVVVGVLR